jgi:guanylate kinase
MSKYKLIALIGEAGSGKDFLLRCTLSEYPEYHEIISCTTRPKRMGEVNGKNYYFLTDKEFCDKINTFQMLEYTEFNNWYYGTMLESLDKNKINIGVFNPAGIRKLRKCKDIDLTVYYVRAPAKERLLRQLNREDDPDVSEVIRRFNTDTEDFNHLNFEYIDLPNASLEDVTQAVSQLGQHRAM